MQAIIQGNLSKNKVGKSRNQAQPSPLTGRRRQQAENPQGCD